MKSAGRTEERIRNNTLTEVLNAVPVKKGDCFFIPSGTLHAICKGVVVVEVQQNSNVTYRVYDLRPRGGGRQTRALHVKQALEVMRRTPPEQHDFSPHLAKCDYFTVDVVAGGYTGTADETSLFRSDTEGEGRLTCGGETVQAKKGDSFFITAGSVLCFNGQLQSPADNRLIITKQSEQEPGLLCSRVCGTPAGQNGGRGTMNTISCVSPSNPCPDGSRAGIYCSWK